MRVRFLYLPLEGFILVKVKNRKKRIWAFYAPAIALAIVVFTTAALVIANSGWAFFIQRSAGVGVTPDNGPTEIVQP